MEIPPILTYSCHIVGGYKDQSGGKGKVLYFSMVLSFLFIVYCLLMSNFSVGPYFNQLFEVIYGRGHFATLMARNEI
jgi:hypothetical protein